MELRQLESFREVVRQGSFTAAARQLHRWPRHLAADDSARVEVAFESRGAQVIQVNMAAFVAWEAVGASGVEQRTEAQFVVGRWLIEV